MNVDELVPVALRGRHEGHRANYARTPVTRPMGQAMKLRAFRKNGTEVPVQISISQLQVGDEQHTVAAIRDVSDADAMAEALRHSAEQTRQLFDLSPVACCVYDAETLQLSRCQCASDGDLWIQPGRISRDDGERFALSGRGNGD